MGKAFGFLLFLIAAAGATAVRGADDGINDGVDRTDPDFVTASLVIASGPSAADVDAAERRVHFIT